MAAHSDMEQRGEVLLNSKFQSELKCEDTRPSLMRAAYGEDARSNLSDVDLHSTPDLEAATEATQELEAETPRRCRRCTWVRDVCSFIWNNPAIFKVIFALCLCAASAMTIDTYLITPLQGDTWGDRQSSYSSFSSIEGGVISLVVAPFFGRWSDRPGNRKRAVQICMLTTSIASILPFVILDTSENAIWVIGFAAPLIASLGFFGGGAPVVTALLTEQLPSQLHSIVLTAVEVCAGVSVGIMSISYQGLKGLFHWSYNTCNQVLIWCSLILCVTAPLLLFCIKFPEKTQTAGVDEAEEAPARAASAPAIAEAKVAASQPPHASSWHGVGEEELATAAPMASPLASLRMICSSRPLQALFGLYCTLYLADKEALNIGSSVLFATLDLNNGTPADIAEKNVIQLWFSTLGAGGTIAGFILVGWLSDKLGAAGSLLWTLPIYATLFASPALICCKIITGKWAYLFGGAGIQLPSCLLPQLVVLAAQYAPSGRLGETMGVMTMGAKLAAIAAPSLSAVLTTPTLVLPQHQWVIFPGAAVIMLCSWAFVIYLYRFNMRSQ